MKKIYYKEGDKVKKNACSKVWAGNLVLIKVGVEIYSGQLVGKSY
jgi:hypothetical protein